jgi:hypothetical protein
MNEGAQETMNDAFIMEKQRFRDRWKKETPWFPMQPFLPCMSDIIPCRIRLCFMTLHMLCSITQSSWSSTQSNTLNGKELSQIPMSRMTSPTGVRTSKLNRSSALSKMTFSWITKQDSYMKARVRSWWHGSKVDRHHVGYLFEISDTRALLGQMADICESTTIWVDDRRKPRSTLGWAWMMYKHYLGESSKDLQQLRKGFRSSHLGEVLSVGLGHDLL